MKMVGKHIRRILAAVLAAVVILSPVASRIVQAANVYYMAWKVKSSNDASVPFGYFVKELNNEAAEEQVAYCLNKLEHAGPDAGDGSSNPNSDLTYRLRTVTATNIYNYVGNQVPDSGETKETGEVLRRKLIAIMRDGYRGGDSKYIGELPDHRIYWAMTQLAIWHYTDGYSQNPAAYALSWFDTIVEDDEENDGDNYFGRTPLWNYYNNLSLTEEQKADIIANLSEDQKALMDLVESGKGIYEKLLTATLTAEEAAKYEFEVYHNWRNTKYDKETPYQNLGSFRAIQEVTKTPVKLSKQAAGGGPELEGATLRLYLVDSIAEDEKVDEWTSGTSAHEFEVYPGATYRLEETQAPKNYVIPDSEWMEFTVDANGNATVTNSSNLGEVKDGMVVMYNNEKPNTPVSFSKTALGQGEELPGAKIEVWETKEDGTPTEKFAEWTSTNEAHVIDKVYEGYYLMREIRSPDGYEIAEDIRFRVNADKTIQIFADNDWTTTDHLVMEDADSPSVEVSFLKTDDEKKPLAGATLTVTRKDDGKEVRTWTSTTEVAKIALKEIFEDEDGDRTDDSDYTEYVFSEVKAPAGYEKSNETVILRVYRVTDADGNVTAKLRVTDENGEFVDADSDIVLTIENKKLPGDPSTPKSNEPTPENPTPNNPTPSNPTPSNPTPSNPTTPDNPTTAGVAAVLGEQRAAGTDGQQAVLGARRAEAKTSDGAPVKLLLVLMTVAAAGLVIGVAMWTKPMLTATRKSKKRR